MQLIGRTERSLQPTDRDYRRQTLNTEWLHTRLIAQHRDLAEGTSYAEALTEEQYALMAEDPLDRSLIRDIATSHRYLGEYHVVLGDAATGLNHYQRAVEMRERLIELDETSIARQRDLAAAIDMKATALWRTGSFDEAIAKHTAAARVSTELAESFPDDVDLTRSVGVSAFNLGELNLALSRREDQLPPMQADYRRAAAEHYHRALDIMTSIRDSGRLSSGDANVIPMLEQRLTATQQAIDTDA